MSEGRGVSARLRQLVQELAKFGTVGAFGVLVNVAVFNLCIRVLDLASVRSGVIATAVAIGTNYLGNRHWTYRHADKSRVRRELTLFLLFSGIGLVIENGVLALAYHGFDLTSQVAQNVAKYVFGLGLGTAFRFWAYRTWVFRRGEKATETVAVRAPARKPVAGVPVQNRSRSERLVRVAAQEEGEDRRVQL